MFVVFEGIAGLRLPALPQILLEFCNSLSMVRRILNVRRARQWRLTERIRSTLLRQIRRSRQDIKLRSQQIHWILILVLIQQHVEGVLILNIENLIASVIRDGS